MFVEIVSAEKEIFSGKATMLFAPAIEGEIGVAPGHTPMVSLLGPGEVRVQTDDKESSFYVQDKYERDEMVINFGLRYDSFDANTSFPSQRRNPINSSTYYLQNSLGNDSLNSEGNLVLNMNNGTERKIHGVKGAQGKVKTVHGNVLRG